MWAKPAQVRQKGGTAVKNGGELAANFLRPNGGPFDRNEVVLVLAFCSFLMKAD
jgi:hypothetical protein